MKSLGISPFSNAGCILNTCLLTEKRKKQRNKEGMPLAPHASFMHPSNLSSFMLSLDQASHLG